MRRLAIPLLALAVLSAAVGGCKTATPYQPRVAGARVGGYSEERLGPDRWRVRFSGNTATSRERVERYLLYRAAELTLQQGADWFEESGVSTEARTRYYLHGRPTSGDSVQSEYGWQAQWKDHGPVAGWRFWRREARSPPDADDALTTQRYVATAEIVVGRGPPPEGRRVLDAHKLAAELRPGIERPPG